MRPALALSALLLAGCTLSPEREPAPQVFPTDLLDCQVAVGLVPLPSARLAERMLPGWRPLQTEDLGLPDDPRGDALLGLWMARCAEGYGGNVTDASYASYFTVAQPPQAMRVEGARFHFLKWETLVPDPSVLDALRAAGAPAFPGRATFGPRLPAAEAFEGSFDMNGTHVVRATGPVPSYPDLAEFRYAEVQPLPGGGYALWNATATSDPLTVGGATIQVPSGFAQRAVGGSRADGYVLVGRTSFTDATVTIPPREE